MPPQIIQPGAQTNAVPVFNLNPMPALENPVVAKLYAAFMANQVWLENWGIVLEWNTLAISAVGQQATASLDPGIDFFLQELMLTSYTAAGTVLANPDYDLELRERSGQNMFTDQAMHVANWTGTMRNSGAKEYRLPFGRYIKGNNVIQANLTNRTATAARVDMALNGIRITYTGTLTREQLFRMPY